MENEEDVHKEALQITRRTEVKEHKVQNHNKFKNTTCFNCNKTGHIAKDCRMKSERDKKKYDSKSRKKSDAFLVSLNYVDIEDV